jgi:immune inhibitor A
MKTISSALVAFNLAIGLALLLAGSAVAVSPPPGSPGPADPDKPNPVGVRELRRGIAPGDPAPARAGRAASAARQDRILTILVEFAGTDDVGGTTYSGPLHNQIPKPEAGDEFTYWVPDFSTAHYREMLFGTTPGARSMSTYFLEQSGGAFTVKGDVYGWVKIPRAEAYYASAGGAHMPELVKDTVQALGDTVPWAQYDEDHDGLVDHVQFVHAGAEEANSWTIWAHSSTLDPAVPTSAASVAVGPYTIEPENGTIGVFCHEFAHDLGLPDLYDTTYGGEASTAYWTLMSTGSWVGAPGEVPGTAPASLGPWEREQLGFVKPVVVRARQRKKAVVLSPAGTTGGTRAIRIDLPDYAWTFHLNTPHGGGSEWWSDKGDLKTTTLTRDVTLPAGSALTFWSWWDIEPDYDYAYVEVQPAGSGTWQTVKGTITTDEDPYLANDGNGITGSSAWVDGNVNGWVLASFDLAAYTGAVKLRFRYTTDTAMAGDGWTWNDLAIRAGADTVFADAAGTQDAGWEAKGWRLTTGSIQMTAKNAYYVEWRAPVGSDVGMDSWPNFRNGTEVDWFRALPGMLVWYSTDQFSDDWVAVHPWQGMLQVVDARPARLPALGTESMALSQYGVNEGLPAPTRINLADAAFSRGVQFGQKVVKTYDGTEGRITIPGGPRISVFNDAQPWVDRFWQPHLVWDSKVWPACYTSPGSVLPDSLNSTTVPVRGVKISVAALHKASGGGKVTVDYSRPVVSAAPR